MKIKMPFGETLVSHRDGIQLMQYFAERCQAWHRHAGLLRLTQRFEEHALQFQRLAPLKINAAWTPCTRP